jgi:hypothetical protein
MLVRRSSLGHDIKSLMLNFSTLLLFGLPFALYFYGKDETKVKLLIGAVIGFLALAVVVPPFGWMRPHPYTDIPGNEPLRFRKDN